MKKAKQRKTLRGYEIVTIALYLLDGFIHRIRGEHIAMKADEIAPGRFTWDMYAGQVSLVKTRYQLQHAKTRGWVTKDLRGWLLTEEGVRVAEVSVLFLDRPTSRKRPKPR